MNQSRNWAVEFDLVVVLALGEDGHLVQVFGEPRCGLREMDEAIFDQCGLGVQAHDLVAFGLVTGNAVAAIDDQLLDQLGAGGLVLDQHDIGAEQVLLLPHGTLQRRIFEPAAI